MQKDVWKDFLFLGYDLRFSSGSFVLWIAIYANAAFNQDVKITCTSSPAYRGAQWIFTPCISSITFLEQTGYKAVATSSPRPSVQLPSPASSNNLSSSGNLKVDFVGFLNQNASFKANPTQIASASSSPLGERSLRSTSGEASIQEEKEAT